MDNESKGLTAELRRLCQLKRTSRNLATVQAQVDELQEHSENADELLRTLSGLREALGEFEGALENAGDENPLLQAFAGCGEAVAYLLSALPGEYDEDIRELVAGSAELCESYDEIKDDREYSADAREEAWGELLDSLENIANALDGRQQ